MTNSFVKQKFMKGEENRAEHRKGFQGAHRNCNSLYHKLQTPLKLNLFM